MPPRPGRRITRVQHWRREIRTERDPAKKLWKAFEFFRSTAATGSRTVPAATLKAIEDMTDELISEAETLAGKIPAHAMERGGWRQ